MTKKQSKPKILSVSKKLGITDRRADELIEIASAFRSRMDTDQFDDLKDAFNHPSLSDEEKIYVIRALSIMSWEDYQFILGNRLNAEA